LCQKEKNVVLEAIEEVGKIAEDLMILITKALNIEVVKTGDLEKTEENLSRIALQSIKL